jgi:hypothetical protein
MRSSLLASFITIGMAAMITRNALLYSDNFVAECDVNSSAESVE